MQSEWLQFLLQFLFAIVATGVVYLIGSLVLKYFLFEINTGNKYSAPYFSIVLGLVIVVVGYSAIVAHGRTIFIIFLPILFGLLYFNKRDTKQLVLKTKTDFFPLLFLFGSCMFFLLIFHFLPESENQQKDAIFYLRICASLNGTGQENLYGSAAMLGKPFVGTEPYHYFEFWWGAILLKCFGHFLPGMQVFRYVAYTTICTSGLLGVFALAQHFVRRPLSVFQQLFCVVFIFYLPDLLAMFHFLQPLLIYTFENNMLERPPLRTLYLFLPGILIALDTKKNAWKVLFWGAGAMLSSVLYMAVLFPALILFYVISFFKENNNKKSNLFVLSGVLAIGLFYIVFYHFTQSHIQFNSSAISISKFIAYFLRYWKIISLATTTSLFTCFWVPLLLLLYIYKKDKSLFFTVLNNKPLLFLCIGIFSGVIFARWLNFVDDAYQFAYIADAASGFVYLILMMFLFDGMYVKKRLYLILSLVIIALFFGQRFVFLQKSYDNVFKQNGEFLYGGKKFSADYLQKIDHVFPKGSKVKGAFWADVNFYDSIFHHSYRNPNVFLLPTSYVLASYTGLNYEFCLSDSADIIYGIKESEVIPYGYVSSAIKRSAFYQYAVNNNTTSNENRLHFIKNNKLQYLILTKNADTSIIAQLPVLKKFQDSSTGERFYTLDH